MGELKRVEWEEDMTEGGRWVRLVSIPIGIINHSMVPQKGTGEQGDTNNSMALSYAKRMWRRLGWEEVIAIHGGLNCKDIQRIF